MSNNVPINIRKRYSISIKSKTNKSKKGILTKTKNPTKDPQLALITITNEILANHNLEKEFTHYNNSTKQIIFNHKMNKSNSNKKYSI